MMENTERIMQSDEKIEEIERIESVNKIIGIEWNMFQNVNNIGGRASSHPE